MKHLIEYKLFEGIDDWNHNIEEDIRDICIELEDEGYTVQYTPTGRKFRIGISLEIKDFNKKHGNILSRTINTVGKVYAVAMKSAFNELFQNYPKKFINDINEVYSRIISYIGNDYSVKLSNIYTVPIQPSSEYFGRILYATITIKKRKI
jgi:hypothetical protein